MLREPWQQHEKKCQFNKNKNETPVSCWTDLNKSFFERNFILGRKKKNSKNIRKINCGILEVSTVEKIAFPYLLMITGGLHVCLWRLEAARDK